MKKLFFAFNAEGSTDNRFITLLVERVVEDFFLDKGVSTEFSWMNVSKKGSSYENILNVCKECVDQNCVLIHRDSDNKTWNEAYANHFGKAVLEMNKTPHEYNPNLVPVIPVRETEAWMLVNKDILKKNIGTTLPNSTLQLNYSISNIESIRDPKAKIQKSISIYHNSLTRKQRRYAPTINDIYDLMASELSFSDLEKLSSYCKFKSKLLEVLNRLV